MTPSAPAPGPPASPWKAHAPLLLILAARLAVGLAYGQVTPIWEADNEDGHFAYARYLAVHRVFLLRTDDPETDDIWEKFQPPLYYNLIALAIGRYDLGERFEERQTNPHLASGVAGVNYALHPPQLSAAESSLAAAVRTARAASAVFSSLGIIFVYLAARRLWPAAPSAVWAATVLVAFWPQYLFVGSMISNDGLVTALSAAGIWLAVALADGGFRLRLALPLALVVGAAILTKLNGAALAPLAVTAMLFSLMRRPAAGGRRRINLLAVSAGLAGLAALTVGALAALNSLEFVTGQIFRASLVRELLNNLGPETEFSARGLVTAALPYGFNTFLASFGWGNLEVWPWLYGLWAFGAAAGVLGLLVALPARWLLRGQPNLDAPPARLLLLMALLIATLLGLTLALAIVERSVYVVSGRYFLPTLPAVAYLLIAGWRAWLPSAPARRLGMQLSALVLLVAGWAIPWAIIAPAYARPPAVTASEANAGLPQHVIFGDRIELISVAHPIRADAGQPVRPVLCWRALAPITANYSLYLEVIGPDGQGYGRLRTYPGRGNYPTSAWVANEPFCETYTINLGSDIPAPALAWLAVAWQAGAAGSGLAAVTAAGEVLAEAEARLPVKVAAAPGAAPPIANTVNFSFGGSAQDPRLRLTGYAVEQAGREVAVTLRWEVVTLIPGDYTMFVHLRDTPVTAYTQGDGPPLGGSYPTHFWEPGEIILDTHWLTLPEGRAPPLDLYVGVADQARDARVAAFSASGEPLAHDEVVLETGLLFP